MRELRTGSPLSSRLPSASLPPRCQIRSPHLIASPLARCFRCVIALCRGLVSVRLWLRTSFPFHRAGSPTPSSPLPHRCNQLCQRSPVPLQTQLCCRASRCVAMLEGPAMVCCGKLFEWFILFKKATVKPTFFVRPHSVSEYRCV